MNFRQIARDMLSQSAADARRLLGAAIDHRRKHPYVYYLFHLRMSALYASLPGFFARIKAWHHRIQRRRYWAKAMATNEGRRCEQAHPYGAA